MNSMGGSNFLDIDNFWSNPRVLGSPVDGAGNDLDSYFASLDGILARDQQHVFSVETDFDFAVSGGQEEQQLFFGGFPPCAVTLDQEQIRGADLPGVMAERDQVCGVAVELESASSEGFIKQEQEQAEEECPRKRGRTGSCSNRSGTKACRERLRREKLNERFVELSLVLEPGRPHKTDKPAILDDAIRALNQLRSEARELQDTNEKLLKEIKSLKLEKNELREEKMGLKAEKEKMEEKMKAMGGPSPGFMPPHPAAFHPTKMAVFPSYGYVPMWQYLPASVHDTSRDHELRPPAA